MDNCWSYDTYVTDQTEYKHFLNNPNTLNLRSITLIISSSLHIDFQWFALSNLAILDCGLNQCPSVMVGETKNRKPRKKEGHTKTQLGFGRDRYIYVHPLILLKQKAFNIKSSVLILLNGEYFIVYLIKLYSLQTKKLGQRIQ